jgi:hypothetical protein
MAIEEYTENFVGYPIAMWSADTGIADPSGTLYRLALTYEEQDEKGMTWTNKFEQFLNDPNAAQAIGLVVGDWGLSSGMQDSTDVVAAISAAPSRLPNLKVLFLGDVTYEECEISWLEHGDISALFSAYPQLEHFCVRGANKLSFGQLRHDQLKTLIVQSGGLSVNVINEILTAQLPQLEHLEWWLGIEDYGGNATVNDLQPLLDGKLFPNLKYLGLRDSEIADDIAKAVAHAPILNRIKTLDLSMGTLGDDGGEALFASPLIHQLEKLDIHHHYCSDDVVDKLEQLPITVDTRDQQEEDKYNGESMRYVAVSE